MSKKPNFVVFMTDHQRWDTVAPFNRCISPNSKELFENGIAFTSNYCPSPHCCPSRATFFTGLYPSKHGIWNNYNCGNAFNLRLNENVTCFPEDLSANGYTTYFSGKWHVSAFDPPAERGFQKLAYDEKLNPATKSEIVARQWEIYSNPKTKSITNISGNTDINNRQPGQIFREGYPAYTLYGEKEDVFNSQRIIDASVDFIKEAGQKDESFFSFTSILAPHDPYVVPQEYLDMYKLEDIQLPPSFYDDLKDKPRLYERTQRLYRQLSEEEYKDGIRHYLAFCTYCDAKFGELVTALKETGKYDDTIIIYLSDHGDYAGDHGLFAKGLPHFEGAYRIPCIIGGGYFKNHSRVVKDFVSLADLAPTILDCAGIKPDRFFSGYSLKPYLEGGKPEKVRDAIFSQSNGNEIYGIQRAVRTDKYKFVFNAFDYDELYDLEKDPNEMHNLIDDPELQPLHRELMKKIWQFGYENNDDCITDYIMVKFGEYGPGIIFEDK